MAGTLHSIGYIVCMRSEAYHVTLQAWPMAATPDGVVYLGYIRSVAYDVILHGMVHG